MGFQNGSSAGYLRGGMARVKLLLRDEKRSHAQSAALIKV
jgi:hypothetical protein